MAACQPRRAAATKTSVAQRQGDDHGGREFRCRGRGAGLHAFRPHAATGPNRQLHGLSLAGRSRLRRIAQGRCQKACHLVSVWQWRAGKVADCGNGRAVHAARATGRQRARRPSSLSGMSPEPLAKRRSEAPSISRKGRLMRNRKRDADAHDQALGGHGVDGRPCTDIGERTSGSPPRYRPSAGARRKGQDASESEDSPSASRRRPATMAMASEIPDHLAGMKGMDCQILPARARPATACARPCGRICGKPRTGSKSKSS